jgi:hypothetical protein
MLRLLITALKGEMQERMAADADLLWLAEHLTQALREKGCRTPPADTRAHPGGRSSSSPKATWKPRIRWVSTR